MEIIGPWDPQMDNLLEQAGRISDELEKGIKAFPEDRQAEKRASLSLFGNLSAVSSTLYKLCKDTSTPCSSQAVGSLVRTAIDSSISVFAFCMAPGPRERAIMYLNYECVLRLQHLTWCRKHIGCPLLPPSLCDTHRIELELEIAERDVWMRCGQFLGKEGEKPGKPCGQPIPTGADGKAQPVLMREYRPSEKRMVVVDKKGKLVEPKWFRDRWFPEKRSAVLKNENMEYLYDILYRSLCSCVHSDVGAALPYAGSDRSSPAGLGLLMWGASVHKLSKALEVGLRPNDAKLLEEQFYKPLQWPPVK